MYALLDFDGDIEASEGNSDVRPLVVGIPAFRLRLDTDPLEATVPQELKQQIATTVFAFGDRWDTVTVHVPGLSPKRCVSVPKFPCAPPRTLVLRAARSDAPAGLQLASVWRTRSMDG